MDTAKYWDSSTLLALWCCLQLLFVCMSFCFQFCFFFSDCSCSVQWDQVRAGSSFKNVPFLCFRTILGCFSCMFWFVFHHIQKHFCSIWLNVSRNHSPIHPRIHPDSSISSHIISKHQWPSSFGGYTCQCHDTASIIFDWQCGTLR